MSLSFAPPTSEHIHQFAINWIDNLVADLDRRALDKTPLAPINHPRLAYWKTLRTGLEACTDDSATRFHNVRSEFLCSRHWDAIRWIHSLVLDAQLSSTRSGVCQEITHARLEEWAAHRAELLMCQKPDAKPEDKGTGHIDFPLSGEQSPDPSGNWESAVEALRHFLRALRKA